MSWESKKANFSQTMAIAGFTVSRFLLQQQSELLGFDLELTQYVDFCNAIPGIFAMLYQG